MNVILTTSFIQDVNSINSFYGWPDEFITTWQSEPFIYESQEYIIYHERISEWCQENNRESLTINLPPQNEHTI
jgi:hypothetical protein